MIICPHFYQVTSQTDTSRDAVFRRDVTTQRRHDVIRLDDGVRECGHDGDDGFRPIRPQEAGEVGGGGWGEREEGEQEKEAGEEKIEELLSRNVGLEVLPTRVSRFCCNTNKKLISCLFSL